jgi:hypothetical protein
MMHSDVAFVATHWAELAKTIFVPIQRSNTGSWPLSWIVSSIQQPRPASAVIRAADARVVRPMQESKTHG